QAEDGIRDRNVTGVQTCALPISPAARPRDEHEITDQLDVGEGSARGGFALDNVCIAPEASSVTMTPTRPTPETVASTKVPATRRSEERRVGTEWGARRRTGHQTR